MHALDSSVRESVCWEPIRAKLVAIAVRLGDRGAPLDVSGRSCGDHDRLRTVQQVAAQKSMSSF